MIGAARETRRNIALYYTARPPYYAARGAGESPALTDDRRPA